MDSNKMKTSDAQLRANRNYHAKKSQDEEYKKAKATRAREYYNQNKDKVLKRQKELRTNKTEQYNKLLQLIKDNNININ